MNWNSENALAIELNCNKARADEIRCRRCHLTISPIVFCLSIYLAIATILNDFNLPPLILLDHDGLASNESWRSRQTL